MKSMCEDFPCPLLQEDQKLWKTLLLMWVLEASQEAQCSPTFAVDLMAFCITIHNVMLLKTKLNNPSLMKMSIIKKKVLYFTKSEEYSWDYIYLTVMFMMLMSSYGLSVLGLTFKLEIRWTTSIPLVVLPKTVCLLSSQG